MAKTKNDTSPLVASEPASATTVQPITEMAISQPVFERKYNDDLLTHAEDLEAIKMLFPEIFHVLDHPELRAEFVKYNDLANKSKRFVHRIGLLAVGLAALALLSSAATPILKAVEEIPNLSPSAMDSVKALQSVSIVLEIAGLLGAAITLGGLWISNWKKKWLEGRLMTEKLRALHFQTMIHRGKEIEDSCNINDANAVKHYEEQRAKWFVAFIQQHRGKLDSQLHELIESPESQYTLLHDQQTDFPSKSTVLPKLFEAYKALRLKHQADYASHKLRKDTSQPFWKPHKWPTNVLKERLNSLSSFCILGALCVSAYVVLAHFGQWPLAHSPALPAFSLCFLVLNVTARGIMDGLAVREESQRYVDYASEVRYLLTKFEASKDKKEKLLIMQDMERAAVVELKGFLRAHSEARFVV